MKKVNAVFLDRDGVINQYPGDFKYVTSLEQFQILPNVKLALERLAAAGFLLYVVSNQAGVAKGFYTSDALKDMEELMIHELGDKVKFTGIFYCLHRPEDNCSCRKPKTGLIDRAVEQLGKAGMEIDRDNSYFVGDSMVDVKTGQAAGLKTILLFSGREKPENQPQWELTPDYQADDLSGAAQIIIRS